MDGLYDSICLTSVAPTLLELCGLPHPEMAQVNEILLSLKTKKIGDRPLDRIVMYNPDAVGLWLYQKYTTYFTDAMLASDLAIPMLSVMPSVTPVCFASMYTGVLPEVHGIRAYCKPVLTQKTVFDCFLEAGKKCAIVSTEGDSISKIFLERNMDYFIYGTVEEVNRKVDALIDADQYDLIVIYNGNYDGTMHRVGPEGEEALQALRENVETYRALSEKLRARWQNHRTLLGFCPDHGCHAIDGGCGSHGLEMEDDMNVIHFYSIF